MDGEEEGTDLVLAARARAQKIRSSVTLERSHSRYSVTVVTAV